MHTYIFALSKTEGLFIFTEAIFKRKHVLCSSIKLTFAETENPLLVQMNQHNCLPLLKNFKSYPRNNITSLYFTEVNKRVYISFFKNSLFASWILKDTYFVVRK